ncbi:MAG: NAD(P)/FAD-dependent oxidoreductase [Erysipelotrichaceae bacterium]|nr:NAD(P)/FAD-dependent oxidoreductase [Erysipelotrichaceae bacterium]
MEHVQAIVIGSGCAGLAAAISLKQSGIQDVLILEKDDEPGGILNQCIHNGFGLTTFHEQLSGPAFAERFEDQTAKLGVRLKHGTMVTKVNPDKTVEYVNPQEGYVTISADAIILAVGCYERSRGAVEIPGERPAGIYTAGQAQRYLNMDGYLVGKRVFILGSGDIGLIMARRMTLEGAKVLGVAELMPYSNGLPRNMKQCLEDFNIPLYLSHTVTHITGHDRLEKIEIAQVDKDRHPIPGTEKSFDVDTLLLSVGLIPENHLGDAAGIQMDPHTKGPVVDENYMTSIDGIFAAGNGLHVHDLADFAAHQGNKAGEGAARYILHGASIGRTIHTAAGENVGYVVPGILHPSNLPPTIEFYFRVRKPLHASKIIVRSGSQIIRTIEKDHLIPSEMENVILAGKQLEGIQEDLMIEVKENA